MSRRFGVELAPAPGSAAPASGPGSSLRLHLIRHGETSWSLTGQHTGRTDLPLTPQGEAEVEALGVRLRSVAFLRVFTSPLRRARQTCAVVGISRPAEVEADLAEWDYGDYEGRTGAEIHRERPEWSIFADGAPGGESVWQITARADRLIARLVRLQGDVALFTHGHFGRVLAARWIGLPTAQARAFLLGTATHGILCFEHQNPAAPAIERWNAEASPTCVPSSGAERQAAVAAQLRRAVERWENEGGEIPAPSPSDLVPVVTSCARRRRVAKVLFAFDLDGTLAESKAPIDGEMAALLHALLLRVKVAIISGGDWPQFQTQVLACLPEDARVDNLVLLPTCGTKCYRYESGWVRSYAESLGAEDKASVIAALIRVGEPSAEGERTWGARIQDRGTQITFSALGEHAPLAVKAAWDPSYAKREGMKQALAALIPGFSIHLGGTTSIDVTAPGIDKAHGIRRLAEFLHLDFGAMVFAGDAVFPGGNDFPVKAAGVDCIRVAGPEETKRVIETFLACAGPHSPDRTAPANFPR